MNRPADVDGQRAPRWRINRLGLRFLAANVAVLGVAMLMIAVAAQAMFINDHDLSLLIRVLIPAVGVAAMVAWLLARPVANDAKRICAAAMQVADGDLSARTGVTRNDELGEAAEMFDLMVERLAAVEHGTRRADVVDLPRPAHTARCAARRRRSAPRRRRA